MFKWLYNFGMCPFIRIGPFLVNSYEFMVFFAIAFTVIGSAIIRPKDFPLGRFSGAVILTLFFIFQHNFGKLLHYFVYIDVVKANPSLLLLKISLAYIITCAVAVFLFLAFYSGFRNKFLTIIDGGAPLAGLEHSLEKVGCLLSGCCRGTLSDVPWNITLADAAWRHPTQAYEMIAAFALFIAGWNGYYRLRKYPGAMAFLAMMLYSSTRFANEFLRIGSRPVIGILTVAHFAMLGMFVLGAAGFYFFVFRKASDKKDLAQSAKEIIIIFLMSMLFIGALLLSGLAFFHKKA